MALAAPGALWPCPRRTDRLPVGPMALAAIVGLLAGAAAVHGSATPHIVFVLTDDNGNAGVGYNNPHISTPTLDALAADGLKLTAHYTYKYCAPTRGAFLTGRMPYRLSATRANLIPWTLPDGIHLNYTYLPRKLKLGAGYRSVHVGKWHQGLFTPEYTPVGRGFDHSLGFLEGGEDHNTSKTFGNWCKRGEVDLSYGAATRAGHAYPPVWPACTDWTVLENTTLQKFDDPQSVDIKGYNPWPAARFDDAAGCRDLCDNRLGCAGYSWRRGDPAHAYYHMCFLVERDGGKHTPSDAFVSGLCRTRAGAGAGAGGNATTLPARTKNGTYTGYVFSDEAVRVVNQHGPGGEFHGQPLFLYLALHNTHAPLEAPWDYVRPYAEKWPTDTKRSLFSGQIGFVDATVRNLTDALRGNGMWDNTLFVWTTDNGSPVFVGGSNHPYRGGKGSNWEGGVRVPTFVAGGVLPAAQRGTSHDGLMHIADWVATFAHVAGIDPAAHEPYPVAPLDSVDAWPWLSGSTAESARTEMVLDHRMFLNATRQQGKCHVVRVSRGKGGTAGVGDICLSAALRQRQWKLVLGPEHQNGWYGWFSPNVTDPVTRTSPSITSIDCYPDPCLFDLSADSGEHHDVAPAHPDVVAAMMRRLEDIAEDEYHPPIENPPVDLQGYCAAVAANGNFVGPWMRVGPQFVTTLLS